LTELRDQASYLRQHLTEAAADVAKHELLTFAPTVPIRAERWLSRQDADSLDTRPQRMHSFLLAMAGLKARGSEEAAIVRKEEEGLDRNLNQHWGSFIASLFEREEEDRLAANECASVIESRAKGSIPYLPLEDKGPDMKQIQNLEQRELLLQCFDEHSAGIACRPVVQDARGDLEQRLEDLMTAVPLKGKQTALETTTHKLDVQCFAARLKKRLVGYTTYAFCVVAAACIVSVMPPPPGGWHHSALQVGTLMWDSPASLLSRLAWHDVWDSTHKQTLKSHDVATSCTTCGQDGNEINREMEASGSFHSSTSNREHFAWQQKQPFVLSWSRATTHQRAMYRLAGFGLFGFLGVSITILGRAAPPVTCVR